MGDLGLEQKIARRLERMNTLGGYAMSLVCTDAGLLVASSGEHFPSEQLAGVVSLFDDIVTRSQRDLDVRRVDEVTLLDAGRGRLVVRPLPLEGTPTFFLVVQAPHRAPWRRNTNKLTKELAKMLAPLVDATP